MDPIASSLYFPLLCQSGLYCADKHSIQLKEEDFFCFNISVLGGLTLWWDNTMAVVCCGSRAEPLPHYGQKQSWSKKRLGTSCTLYDIDLKSGYQIIHKWLIHWHGQSPSGPIDSVTPSTSWVHTLNKWGGVLGGKFSGGGLIFCYHKMSTSSMCSEHLNM